MRKDIRKIKTQQHNNSIEIIRNLDLIISADTAVAHLSATIGKKTLIPLPLVSDWRWFRNEKKSIFYYCKARKINR